jgi:suppressor of ftsI
MATQTSWACEALAVNPTGSFEIEDATSADSNELCGNGLPRIVGNSAALRRSMTVVALDGMPLTYHDPKRHTEELRHVLLAPGGRAEVIVEGPKPGSTTSLRSLCVNTGADGDPNPNMVLADLETNAKESAPTHSVQAGPYDKAIYKPLSNRTRDPLERSAPDFTGWQIAMQ